MHHTPEFQLVIVWGYLCQLQHVYILTYCLNQPLLSSFFSTIIFLITFYELLITYWFHGCTKTQNCFIQLLGLRLNQLPIWWTQEASSSGVQQPQHLAGYSPSSSANVNVWTCTSAPQYAFTAYPGMDLTLPLLNYTVLNSKQDYLCTQASQPILKIKIWVFQEQKLILQAFG